MKKLLILGAGAIQLPIIKIAKESGYYTIVVDYDKYAPGLIYADKTSLVSTLDKEAILDIAKKERIDGILTTSDYPVNVVAYIGNKLGLHTMEQKVADICTNKFKQRSLFQNNGIKTPFFKLCKTAQDLDELIEFPYIVKPTDSSASRGVRKVNNIEELHSAYIDAMQYSRSKQVLVESYIEGREFSVETITQRGHTVVINITEKITKGEEFGCFVEDLHIEPARLTQNERSIIENEVITAIELIGLNNCPSHTEVKLNEKGAYIIEVACRLGGDYISSDLVPLSTGIDMMNNLIRISIGEPIDVSRKINKISFIQFFNHKNYFDCIKFINENKDSIYRYDIGPKHNRPIRNSMDRMGYLIMQVEDYSELYRIMNIIHK